MNRTDVTALLKRRSSYNSQPYGPDVVDAWTEALGDVDTDAAMAALLAAHLEHGTVTLKALKDALAKRTTRVHTDPIGNPDCPDCAGTGFVEADDGGVTRCSCERANPVLASKLSRDEIAQLVAGGIAQARRERQARIDIDPVYAARYAHFQRDMVLHGRRLDVAGFKPTTHTLTDSLAGLVQQLLTRTDMSP